MDSTTTSPAEAARSREHTRDRLIDAAYEVFAEQGLSAPSVEAIVERAGFTRGAFYSNFDSKTELFFAIADAQYKRALTLLAASVDQLLARALPEGAPITAAAVEQIITEVLSLTDERPRWVLFDAEFEVLALRDPEIARRYVAYQDACTEAFAELLAGALARIGVRFTLPPRQATRMIFSTYWSARRNSVLGGQASPAELASSGVLADVTALAYALTERVA